MLLLIEAVPSQQWLLGMVPVWKSMQCPSEHTTEGRSNFNPTSWAEFQIQANGFDLLLEDLDRLMLSTGWYISSAPWSDGWECMELGKRSCTRHGSLVIY
ncbi:hypothetical protein D9757_011356 [Collybiopsis confluens]|uniref:Uncharacterized protein n=1 Tax=Collybiopsis confluens TaxID=2823264 RepID=A0A8H5LLC5_9AGAR|nr:hypothetical protein D9757_011356 [Collybiopsis confluens]